MGIESIFSKSWQEFKNNVFLFLKLVFLFVILPGIILILILSCFSWFALNEIDTSISNFSNWSYPESPNLNNFSYSYVSAAFLPFTKFITGKVVSGGSKEDVSFFALFLLLFLFLFLFLVSFFIFALCLMYLLIYNEKGEMGVKEVVKGGLKYFWKFLGLVFLLTVLYSLLILVPFFLIFVFFFLVGVKGLFYAPFIILFLIFVFCVYIFFSIKFLFSPFILFKENTGVIESLKKSWNMVEGRWWKVFGYYLLFTLIYEGAFLFLYIFVYLLQIPFVLIFSLLYNPVTFTISFFFLSSIIFTILLVLYMLLFFFYILFIKNLYLEIIQKRACLLN